MKSLYCLIAIAILFAACNMSDDMEDIGNGYQFVREDAINASIIGDYVIPANVVAYSFNNNFILAEQHPNKESYKSFLNSNLFARYYAYCKRLSSSNNSGGFDETITDDKVYKILHEKNVTLQNTQEDIIKINQVSDSVIKYDVYYQKIFASKVNYWIISHKDKKMYGPLTKDEYLKERIELKIPDNLQLKPVE